MFHEVLEREFCERSAFLAEACAGDESLRREVETLIESHRQSESFFEIPAGDVAAELFAADRAKLVGQTVGPYKIIELLGTGGMGEVYLAQDVRLDRKVALKLLPAYLTKDAGRLRRFEQEARSDSSLNHPNILTIYEIGQRDGVPFIATEFVDGETLRQHLAGASLPLASVLDVGISWLRLSRQRTRQALCIGTSSPRTSCSGPMAT